MTLSVSEYRAKIAACATKATTLMNPVIKGAKEAVPEMWFGSAEEATIKHVTEGDAGGADLESLLLGWSQPA